MSRILGPVRLLLTAGGAVALAAAAGAAPTSGATPTPSVLPTPQTASVTRATVLCPGAERSGVPGLPDRATSATMAVVAAPVDMLEPDPSAEAGQVQVSQGGSTDEPVALGPGRALSRTVTAPDPLLVTATGQAAPGALATSEVLVARADLRGLATVPCAPATDEAWLVGGGGRVGDEERVVLSNPSDEEAVADVSVLGTSGSRQVVVPGRGRAVLLVDALAAEAHPVIHVRARTGTLGAVLATSSLVGTSAVGIDTGGPVATPARQAVVPAVLISGAGVVRVAVPGSAEGVVRVSLVGPAGLVAQRGGGVIRVPAGRSADLPVTAPEGVYSVVVEADVPVLAAASGSVRDTRGAGDLAWGGSTGPLTSLAGIALPRSPNGVSMTRRLVLLAPAPGTVEVLVVAPDGTTRTVDVSLAANRPGGLDVDGASAVWVRATPSAPVRAAVVSVAGPAASRLFSVAPLLPVTTTAPVRVVVAEPRG